MSGDDLQEVFADDGERQVEVINVKVEYRKNKNTKTEINSFFFVEYVNGIVTDNRQCIKCKTIVNACNSGTSTMRKHWNVCQKKDTSVQRGQSILQFKKSTDVHRNNQKGLSEVARLVYKDRFSVNSIV